MIDTAGASASAHNAKAVAGISTAELQAILAERAAEYEAGAQDRLVAGLEASRDKIKAMLDNVEERLALARKGGIE